MRVVSALLGICILFSAAGCAVLPQRYQLAAEPLMEVKDIPGMAVPPPSASPPTQYAVALKPIDQVNLLVQDSQTKCAHFVDSMFAETAGAGFVLDILSTGTSALATVFTPLATVHSLTASSTIFGAAKTGISANYLNTLTISHITQAIQSGYTSNMQNYIASLDTVDPTKINVFQERSKIVSYHNQCSLAAAEASISSSLQPTGQTGQAVSVPYTVKPGDNTAAGLASALVPVINAAFKQAGISASSSGAVISLTMTSPVNFTVSVSPSNPNLITIVQGTPAVAARLTITQTPRSGDTITITASPATQQPSSGVQPSGGTQTAPAAVIP